MARVNLAERISQGVFFLDGAMGTQLFARRAGAGLCNDYLNIEAPDIVTDVHNAYLNAGSDAVITNTFGGNKYALGRHGYSDKAEEINLAGARIGRKSAGEDKYVLGDIGPCGDFLEPLGAVKADELKAAFSNQAKALAEGGVDGFIIETMTAVEEIAIAVEAVKSVSDLPIFASLAYDPAGEEIRTMMGVAPARAVKELVTSGIVAIGFNCGTLSMDEYVKLTQRYAEVLAESSVALLAEPNAGKPELIDGKAVYTLSPEDFAEEVVNIHQAGAKILGGCCGTGPAHIEAAVKRLKG
jgi:5-methyltetrahydrofolate--homocysteine methyltransferase